MGISPDFNHMEFFEFIWMYERMSKQRQEENDNSKRKQGNMSISDMLGGQIG